MNWADYAIIVVLALSVLVGLWRGFIDEVLALAIWVAAVVLAWLFGPKVAALFEHTIDDASIRIILAYALCFVGVLILGALLRFIVGKLVKGTGISGSDRMLGMVFGLVRGALVVTIVVFLIGFTTFPRERWWQQSRLLPAFTAAATWFGHHLPDSVQRYLRPPAATPWRVALPARLEALPDKAVNAASGLGRAVRPVPAGAGSAAPAAGAKVAPAGHSRDNWH